ncbi:MAG TPA: glycosyltransferase family 2 protein [Candidatus Bathyarchaeia archaeon]|nr:glycosyltransferase family 2 protein [Candidatus Bathyarchaeia archaeon]
MIDYSKILAIVPAFNEEASIEGTLSQIREILPGLAVLVIDDGSRDQTARLAAVMGARVLSFPFNIGIGGAISCALTYAQEQGYELVVRIDGDGQHDLKYVPALLMPLQTGEVDLAIGSRFIGPFQSFRSSFCRRVGILFFARLLSFLTGQPVTDPTSGFQAFGQKAIALFADHYPSDYPEPEAIVIARRAGLRIVEVPVEMRQRVAGASSIRYLKTLYYMINVTFAVLLNYLKPTYK